MIPGKLTISRPCYGGGRDKISITIKDQDAGVELVELEIDLDQFAKALTGQGNLSCHINPKNLDVIGKIRKRDEIKFKISDKTHYGDSKELAIEEAKDHTPDGWIASEYYGSQSSFFYVGDEHWARTAITRWVDR